MLCYVESCSLLVLCNPGERTTGTWPQVWQVAQKQLGQLGLWELLSLAGPADLLDQLWARTVLSQCRAQAALRTEWFGLVAEGAAPSPLDSAGGQQQLYWVTFISLCVSIRAWRTCGSRTSLSPMIPRPMHLTLTLDFFWHCQHKFCFQKKPSKVKGTPCS